MARNDLEAIRKKINQLEKKVDLALGVLFPRTNALAELLREKGVFTTSEWLKSVVRHKRRHRRLYEEVEFLMLMRELKKRKTG